MKKTIINSLIIGLSASMLVACGGGSSDMTSQTKTMADGEACAAAWVSTTAYATAA